MNPDNNLKNAFQDYYFLICRDYPEKSILKLVGDKYMLTRVERSVLYRGIFNAKKAEARRAKKVSSYNKARLRIDTFNILLTIVNYLNGRPVFISNDGFLRDAGELRGRIHNWQLLDRSLNLLFNFILSRPGSEYLFYLDRPVSKSGMIAQSTIKFLRDNKLMGEAMTCNSPDNEMINLSVKGDIICSSDTVIIDNAACSAYDLTYYILTANFQPQFTSLSEYLNSSCV